MTRAALIVAGAAIGGAVWYAVNRNRAEAAVGQEPEQPGPIEEIGNVLRTGLEIVTPFSLAISLDKNADYVAVLRAVEDRYRIPRDLLVRLAYQESRFRTDIITGATVSSAGAVGMMQIVPRWHPGVDPLDWRAAADYAGAYLARLYAKFGAWDRALAAYNWGEGNLIKYGIARAPEETRNYYTQILADVGGGTYA